MRSHHPDADVLIVADERVAPVIVAAAWARRRVAVVDAGSPRNAPAAHMQGFLSFTIVTGAAFAIPAR